MKTRLLRRLRRQAEKEYRICRYDDGFYVTQTRRSYSGDVENIKLTLSPFKSVDEAKGLCDEYRRQYIIAEAHAYMWKNNNRVVYGRKVNA